MRIALCSAAIMVALCGLAPRSVHATDPKPAIRPPAVAGQFYPLDSATLARAVDDYLKDAVTPSKERPIAIIAPHAGYVFSGQIAADAFKQAAAFDYDLVVLLGTNHTVPPFGGVSIYPGGFRTPLGVAEADEDLATALRAADKDFAFDASSHVREHSVEVQVPFVQRLFPKARILPVVVGTTDLDICSRFGIALAAKLAGRKALIVASSDLSHYPNYEDAQRVDRQTLSAITSLDMSAIQEQLQSPSNGKVENLVTRACGEGPILTAIAAARRLGATSAWIISCANSGETAVGDHSRVVGYGAVAIVRDSIRGTREPFGGWNRGSSGELSLSDSHKKTLLAFARKTIDQYLTSETAPLPRGFDSMLNRGCGAFVTLNEQGQLRGCIGHMSEDLPLGQTVGYCALQAALNDPRFPPVGPEEWPRVQIEISVLTPLKPVAGYGDIQIGRDGVLIEKDGRSAVFLPQVAPEQGWNRDQMLDNLCAKAGLPSDAWRQGASFRTFQAIVFSESNFH